MKESRRFAWTRSTATGAAVVVVVALVVLVLTSTSAGGSAGGSYQVRAIFDDAVNVVSGEDVKIDGVTVGTVGSVTPTPQARAAVVLNIANPAFQGFRSDATCTIKPQSLLGEQFVECEPTQPRPVGTPVAPLLRVIPTGQEGAGEYLLPVANTSSPVDVDLLEDIARLPERQRLTIILNELGTGLAGKGSDIAAVVRRADPALRETDKVLDILGSEDKILANLAVDSAKALKPLAAVRGAVADFIVKSNRVAESTAAKRAALAKDLVDLPSFLRQLGPAMTRLGAFARQTTPVFTDLGIAAPQLDKTFTKLGGFSESSNRFFHTLGSTAKSSGGALVDSEPVLKALKSLGASAKPFAGNTSELLSNVRDTGGLEQILNFIFLGAGAANGYDSLGHFLRAQIIGNTCITYQVTPTTGCHASFDPSSATAAKAPDTTAAKAPDTSVDRAAPDTSVDRAAPDTTVIMARTLAVLEGATPAQAIAKYPGPANSGSSATTGSSKRTESGASTRAAPSTGSGGTATGGAATGGTATGGNPTTEPPQAGERLLDYLLGG